MKKLLTTLLPTLNSLKQSNLDKNNLLPLTTHLLPLYKSFLYSVFNVSMLLLFAHLINKVTKMYIVCI